MSLAFEIESELDRVVAKDLKRRIEVQHERISEGEVRDLIHQEFAEWLVKQFDDDCLRTIQIICGDCKAPWTSGHMCVDMVIHEKA